MYHLALKMLFADGANYIMLVSGLTLAALLMTQQAEVFFGILDWTNGNLKNKRDTDVSRVRSVQGIARAVPMFWSRNGFAVHVRNVTKISGSGEAKTQALKGVNFDAREGESLMIVGPSGCGKTTLLSDEPTSALDKDTGQKIMPRRRSTSASRWTCLSSEPNRVQPL